MDGGPLHLASVGGIPAPGFRVVLRQDLYHVARLVLDAAGALDQVGPLQAALRTGGIQALILGNGSLQEVLLLNIQMLGEGDRAGPGGRVVGVVLHLHQLAFPLGVVGDGQLNGTQHRHGPLGVLVQVLPEAVLQEAVFHHVGRLCHTDALTEVPDRPGRIAPAAQAAERGHPGIVPAGDPPLLHQLAELALGEHRVVDAQAGELDLPGMAGQVTVLYHPVV